MAVYPQTSVWEIDGARHREILSNSAFLRELRMELRNIFNDGVTADKVGFAVLSTIFDEASLLTRESFLASTTDVAAAHDRHGLLLELPPSSVRVPGLLRVPVQLRRRCPGPIVPHPPNQQAAYCATTRCNHRSSAGHGNADEGSRLGCCTDHHIATIVHACIFVMWHVQRVHNISIVG